MPASTNLSVRPLTPLDEPEFMRLAADLPGRMLSSRMNFEVYGPVSETARFWGAFSGLRMAGSLCRFRNTTVAVDSSGECGHVFAEAIDAEVGLAGVRGSIECAVVIQACLRRYVCADWEDSRFMRLLDSPKCSAGLLSFARKADSTDIDALVSLYSGAGMMYRSRSNLAERLATGRVFVVDLPERETAGPRIVSCALLNVESRDAGMIGGVYTLPAVRGRGYAVASVAALCKDLQKDAKLPCLYYENPVAGRLYQRLGFQESGRWAVLYLVRRP